MFPAAQTAIFRFLRPLGGAAGQHVGTHWVPLGPTSFTGIHVEGQRPVGAPRRPCWPGPPARRTLRFGGSWNQTQPVCSRSDPVSVTVPAPTRTRPPGMVAHVCVCVFHGSGVLHAYERDLELPDRFSNCCSSTLLSTHISKLHITLSSLLL